MIALYVYVKGFLFQKCEKSVNVMRVRRKL